MVQYLYNWNYRRRRERECAEKLFEEIKAKIFLDLIKHRTLQIQDDKHQAE